MLVLQRLTEMNVDGVADTQTEEQHALVLQMMQHTKLTYQFAYLCLEQNGWQPATALANFAQLHQSGGIPPEGFVA